VKSRISEILEILYGLIGGFLNHTGFEQKTCSHPHFFVFGAPHRMPVD